MVVGKKDMQVNEYELNKLDMQGWNLAFTGVAFLFSNSTNIFSSSSQCKLSSYYLVIYCGFQLEELDLFDLKLPKVIPVIAVLNSMQWELLSALLSYRSSLNWNKGEEGSSSWKVE